MTAATVRSNAAGNILQLRYSTALVTEMLLPHLTLKKA